MGCLIYDWVTDDHFSPAAPCIEVVNTFKTAPGRTIAEFKGPIERLIIHLR